MFIQTRRYASSKVREVSTRDSTGSLSLATDRKLHIPENRGMSCPWEPRDSAVGPGKLFLDGVCRGGPGYKEFGPVEWYGDGEPVDKPWVASVRKTWKEIQDHYSDAGFTLGRIQEWEAFFRGYPWGGLSDLHPQHVPPFSDLVFPEQPPSSAGQPRPEILAMVRSIGEDQQGRARLAYSMDGQDLMSYPPVMSRVTYGNKYLDGTAHIIKKRKRRGKAGTLTALTHGQFGDPPRPLLFSLPPSTPTVPPLCLCPVCRCL